MKKNLIIAIDGFSGTGKGTTAKIVASKLGLLYVDTGAMYRAFTLFCIQNNIDYSELEKVKKSLDEVSISFSLNKKTDNFDVFLNGQNVEGQIRTLEVSQMTAKFANIGFLRKWMVDQQRKLGQNNGVVMDGRDIGSEVFPNADIKIFLDADVEVRANRRFKQIYKNKIVENKEIEIQKIILNIKERDNSDKARTDILFEKYENEVTVIDTTRLTIDEQVNKVLKLVDDKFFS